MPASNMTSQVRISVAEILLGPDPSQLSQEDQTALSTTLVRMRRLEDEMLKTGLSKAQRRLLGQMRYQRQGLWCLVDEEVKPEGRGR